MYSTSPTTEWAVHEPMLSWFSIGEQSARRSVDDGSVCRFGRNRAVPIADPQDTIGIVEAVGLEQRLKRDSVALGDPAQGIASLGDVNAVFLGLARWRWCPRRRRGPSYWGCRRRRSCHSGHDQAVAN